MTNRQVADILNKIADILLIKDENPFKIGAYRRAAQSVYHLDEDLRSLYQKDRIGEIPGVGKAVKQKIEELLEKDSLEYYEKLVQEVPAGVIDMLSIPGIGHKTVKLIYEELGIDNLDDLLKAAQEGKIRNLPGIGEKTEYNIKQGIELLKQNSGKVTLGLALPLAEEFRDYLTEEKGIEAACIVGSLRRGKPLVSDIDILVSSHNYKIVHERVESFKEVKEITKKDQENISGKLTYDIEFEVIIVNPRDYYHSMVWTTGSKAHRSIIFTDVNRDELAGLESEEKVYEKLELGFIPPELRENRGEVKKSRQQQLPELIKQSDIKGDLHIHTDWSDGAGKILEMADAARQLNYSYIAVTDHSKSLPISGGLNEERLFAQGKTIDAINMEIDDFHILKGIEVDILKDGSLDFSDEVLKDLDIVIASIHSNFKLDKDRQTERIINAIKNEHVDVIGHLSGRLLNRRSGYELDIEKVLETAAKNQVALEINSHPDRLDIDEETAFKAKDYGIKIAINSDAHHEEDLKLIKYGVISARRGWLQPDDVINTWSKDKLIEFLKK